MKNSFILCSILLVALMFLPGCSTGGGTESSMILSPADTSSPAQTYPEFTAESVLLDDDDTSDPQGNLVVVISDIHLGDERSIKEGYAWFNKNESILVDFLKTLAGRQAVKEVVIDGDMFDEWVIPMDHDTFNGFGSGQEGESRFVDSIAQAHPDIISGIKTLIQSGRKVTYVPGNHDMLVTREDIDRIFPGISQQRDAAGLGTYSPGGLAGTVIEHSHRYDFFNAPDMLSNRIPYSPENYTTNSGAIIPPGFFVSKIAASNGYQSVGFEGSLGLNSNSMIGPFYYWAAWKLILSQVKPTQDYNAKIIKTGIDGYTGVYAINDLVPQVDFITINQPLLYRYIEDNWQNRQAENLVPSSISVLSGLLVGSLSVWCDFQSRTQYFSRDTGTRVVVFGHTHKATLGASYNANNDKCIYANSGTWIDKGDPDCTMVIIDPDSQLDGSVKETVSVYQFTDKGTMKQLYTDSITLKN
ncbi:MAG: metallophosphoesterase [Candidatus Eremiobacteraeota bacterium]|nr:metallophosphoesterase [Candidatus Eremiobacteraeota bacterium]